MTNKQRERLLVVGALSCIVLFVGNIAIINPLTAAWKARSEEIGKLETSITSGNTLVTRRAHIEDQYREMRGRSLPADRAVAQAIVQEAVGTWARNSRLNVTSIKPRWVVTSDDPAQQLEVRVSAGGSIEAVSRFLYELEQDPMALRVEQVELRARDERGAVIELEARFTGLILPEEKTKS
jgi:hypothetical protein